MAGTADLKGGEAKLDAQSCSHHWLIETPAGPSSMGRCKNCGAQRTFLNSFSGYLWDDYHDDPYSSLGEGDYLRRILQEEE